MPPKRRTAWNQQPETIEVRAAPGRPVYFISDVHLGYGTANSDAARENLLVELLQRAARDASHVFIVGDLFDAWFDYRHVIPNGHVRTLASLATLRSAGVPVTYLMGNHDFAHYRYFRDVLGIAVHAGDVEAVFGDMRWYIAHGDGKAFNDGAYLLLRGLLRNRLAQALYRLIHPDLGIWLASKASHGSRDYTTARDFGQEDGLRAFATSRIEAGFDVVVMGHRHQVRQEHIGTGLYVNLGHWLCPQPTFALFNPGTQTMQVGMVQHWLRYGNMVLD
jgi:UDP-2,3-diacylglucosamine hydrolase